MQAEERVEFRRKRSLNDVIGDTFTFVKHTAGPLGKSILYAAGPPAILFAALLSYFNLAVLEQMETSIGGSSPQEMGILISGQGTAAILYMAVLFAATFILTTVMNLIVFEAVIIYEKNEEEVTVPAIFAGIRKDFLMVFFTNLGMFVIIFLAAMVITFVGAMTLILIPIAVLVILIGGIYLWVPLHFVVMIRVEERVGFRSSISRSIRLLSGYWWNSFGLFLVLYIVVWAVVGSLGLIPGGVGLFMGGSMGFLKGVTIFSNVMTVVFSIFYFIPMIATAFQYYTIVEEREGTGLLRRLDTITDEGKRGYGEAGAE
ncbi:MAG: hypothetical protein GY754_37795 [bacterium]|nr:hypothetical protein [bacterium]